MNIFRTGKDNISIKWCCSNFQSAYDNGGERGESVLVLRDYFGKAAFALQHRCSDKAVEPTPVTDYPIAWVTQSRIFFCPWCGKKLEKWYREPIDRLLRPELSIE